jgi:hypothetical protein
MEADFPAAHSMDTLWFAIDRDGHVACFGSGEAGAVPSEAFAGEEAYRACDRLAQVLPRGEAIQDLQGRLLPRPEGPGEAHLVASDWDFPVLMFLPSAEPVRAELTVGRVVQVPAAEGVAVVWPRLSRTEHERLHTAGMCRGCFFHFDQEGEGESPNPALHGLYRYGHLTENWISGPYGRQQVPAQPVHIDQLPPDLRREVKRMRFDTLQFTEAPHIQPLEHSPCVSWEAAYLDVTGKKIRPIPGMEDTYAERYDEYRDESGRFEIEPPAGESPDEDA